MKSVPPPQLTDLTRAEKQAGRRVRVARPDAVRGVELVWHTAWGSLLPAVLEERYQLVRIDESHTIGRCGSREYTFHDGMVCISTPQVYAQAIRRVSPYTRLRVMLIDPTLVKALSDDGAGRLLGSHYAAVRNRGLRVAMDAFFRAVVDGDGALQQESALLACVSGMVRVLGSSDPSRALPRTSSRVRRVIDFLRASYADNLSLDDVTRAAGNDLHPRYLLSVFKSEVGLAPYQYLTRVRIAQAQRLLADGHTAASVAKAVGFCDGPQLHRHFVRVVGMTPGEYARATRPLLVTALRSP